MAYERDGNQTLGVGYFVSKGQIKNSRTDTQLQQQIWRILLRDPLVDPTEIEVDVKKGEVSLQGTVSAPAIRHEIESRIAELPGVRSLQNRLQILKKYEDAISA